MVLYWIEQLLSKASREDLLDVLRNDAHVYMQGDITSIRDSASGVFAHLYCKIPYIYMQLLTCMVKIYLIVVAVIAGSSMRAAETRLERILPTLLVLVANFAYEGILHVHVSLWNPLGSSINAFPCMKFLEFVWKTTHQFLKPPSIILPYIAHTGPDPYQGDWPPPQGIPNKNSTTTPPASAPGSAPATSASAGSAQAKVESLAKTAAQAAANTADLQGIASANAAIPPRAPNGNPHVPAISYDGVPLAVTYQASVRDQSAGQSSCESDKPHVHVVKLDEASALRAKFSGSQNC